MQADFSTLIINEAASYETNVIAARFSLGKFFTLRPSNVVAAQPHPYGSQQIDSAEHCVNKHLEDILCNLEDAGHQLFLTGYHMPFQLDELNPMTFSELQVMVFCETPGIPLCTALF